MAKKNKIIFSILFAVIVIINSNVYAAKDVGTWKNISINTNSAQSNSQNGNTTSSEFNPDAWKPTNTTETSGTTKIEEIANNIIGPIRVIGSIISVIALICIGIKYIFGSVEEKAEYKQTLKPYLIGAVMVFAITNLLAILIDIVGGF